jgi:hypothetical protein
VRVCDVPRTLSWARQCHSDSLTTTWYISPGMVRCTPVCWSIWDWPCHPPKYAASASTAGPSVCATSTPSTSLATTSRARLITLPTQLLTNRSSPIRS